MLIKEFTVAPSNEFSIDTAVQFHDELNPKIFQGNTMRPEIREGLLKIAQHFEEFIGVKLNIVDITVSGSNAAFSYTEQSDLDLHLVVEVPDEPEYAELLDAKKNVYNAKHDIKVKGIDVELYAQPAEQKHYSLGIYSVMNDSWVSEPTQQQADINENDVHDKYKNYRDRIRVVLKDNDLDTAEEMWNDVSRMRKAGLASNGEFSTENVVFKMLRGQGWLEKLKMHIANLQDQELSIEQRTGL
jgi:predicted nucleotidyltransferase